jgi:hypothetical protein
MIDLQQHLKKLEARIDVMVEKCETNPCWMNTTLLDCMLRDYESKQRLLLQDEQKQI